MKKHILIFITIFALTLSACGASNATSTTASANESAAALSTGATLLVGTLKLSGTAQDITAEQAAALLPFWQVYSDLISSDTAAQAEVDALLKQIQETMTDDQMNAINAMQLTQQDIFAVMQEQGMSMSRSNSSSSGTDTQSNSGMGAPPDGGGGGMPMDAPPDGGGGMPMGDAGGSSNNSSTSTSSSHFDPSTILVQALIESLQAKIAS